LRQQSLSFTKGKQMQPIRQIYQDAPNGSDCQSFRRYVNTEIKETDAKGCPIGFFEQIAGSIPDLP